MTSGIVNTNTEYESRFFVRWSQVSQDSTANKTTVRYECGVYCGHNFYNNAIQMSAVSINGVQVYAGGTYSQYMVGEHIIASGNIDVYHNADGTGSITIGAFTGWLYANHNYSANSQTFALETIVRGAVLTSGTSSAFTNLIQPSMAWSAYSGDGELKATIEFGSLVLGGATVSNTGSYTFSLTSAEIESLVDECLYTEGIPVDIVLSTWKNGVSVFRSVRQAQFTVSQTSGLLPTISLSVSPNSGTIYKGVTNVTFTATVTTKHNADINSLVLSIPDTYDDEVGNGEAYVTPIFKSGSVAVTATITDSRGFTNTATQTVVVSNYVDPDIVPNDVFRYNYIDGNIVKANNGVYIAFDATISGSSQELKLYEQHKESQNDVWSTKYEMWNYGGTIWITSFSDVMSNPSDTTKSYDFRFILEDEYNSDYYYASVPSESVTLHLGKGGRNVAVGKFADTSEPNVFESAWFARLYGGATIGFVTVDSHSNITDFAEGCEDGLTPYFANGCGETPLDPNDYGVGVVFKTSREIQILHFYGSVYVRRGYHPGSTSAWAWQSWETIVTT